MARGGSTDVRQLLLQVDASVALAQRNLQQLAGQVQRDSARMDQSLARIDGATARLGTAFGRLNNVVGAFGVSLGAATFIQAGRSILNYADDLDAAADRAGVGVERYQTLQEALRALEVPAQAVDKIFERLLSTLGSVQNGADNGATQALDRLGIRSRILNGEIETSDELLDAIAASAQRAGSQSQFASEMAEIFGRRLSGQLVPALYDGGDALHSLEQAMRDSGTVIDEEMVQRLADANERLDRFWESTRRNAAIWAADFISAFDRTGDAVDQWLSGMPPGMRALVGVANAVTGGAAVPGEARGGGIIDSFREQLPGATRGPSVRRPPSRTSRSGSRSTQRSETQAWEDFAREAAARGIQMTPGGGFRTAGQQHDIFERGLSPLDGFARPSRHQSHQAFDPRSRTHSDQAALAAANAAGLRGFEIVHESGGRVHYEWSGHGRPGEIDFSRSAAAREPPATRVDIPLEESLSVLQSDRSAGEIFDEMMHQSEEIAANFAATQASLRDFSEQLGELPSIPERILSEEDQHRLDNFVDGFNRDLADGLANAIMNGENLGDALVNAIRRAAFELLSSGLMDLLSGRAPQDTLLSNLFGGGGIRLGGGGKGAGPVDFFGGALQALSFGGGKAGGGDVMPGKWYLTGERGPEIVVPKVPSVVIPNHALGRGGAQRLDVRVRLDSDMLRAEVINTSAGVIAQASPHIEQRAAGKAIAGLMRRSLP